MNNTTFVITREKHMDHLVKVVPLIVLTYALQCYVLGNYVHQLGSLTIIFLGVALAALISAFITYDVKYKATLDETGLSLAFFGFQTAIPYEEIFLVEVIDAQETFGKVFFHTKKSGKIRLYFVDEPAKIKEWVDSKQTSSQQLAA